MIEETGFFCQGQVWPLTSGVSIGLVYVYCVYREPSHSSLLSAILMRWRH